MNSDRSSAIAAAIILAITMLSLYFMPQVMNLASTVSPWLSAGIAALFVLAFFGVVWLRGRWRRSRDGEKPGDND